MEATVKARIDDLQVEMADWESCLVDFWSPLVAEHEHEYYREHQSGRVMVGGGLRGLSWRWR